MIKEEFYEMYFHKYFECGDLRSIELRGVSKPRTAMLCP